MSVPNWYQIVLLALGAFRFWKIIGEDAIFDRPRERLVKRLGPKFDELITCPWCAGFWVSLCFWGAWQAWPHAALIVCVPLTISAIVGAVGQKLYE